MTDAWKIGHTGTDTLTGRTVLIMATDPLDIAAGGHQHFRYLGADYQVPGATTYYITGYQVATAGAGRGYLEIRYADDAALTTNVVVLVAGIGTAVLPAGASVIYPCGRLPVPTGHYLGIWNPTGLTINTVAQVTVMGYEQA